MDDDIAVPFANRRNGYRVNRVDVHDALKKHWQMHWHMQIIMADEEFLL